MNTNCNSMYILYIFLISIISFMPLMGQEGFYEGGSSGVSVAYGYSKLDSKYNENSKGVGVLAIFKGKYALGINISNIHIVDKDDIDDYFPIPYRNFDSFTAYISGIIREDNNGRRLPAPIVATIGYNSTQGVNSIIFGASIHKKIELGNLQLVPDVSCAYLLSISHEEYNNAFIIRDDFSLGINLGVGIKVFESIGSIFCAPGISFSKDQKAYGFSLGFAFNKPKTGNDK